MPAGARRRSRRKKAGWRGNAILPPRAPDSFKRLLGGTASRRRRPALPGEVKRERSRCLVDGGEEIINQCGGAQRIRAQSHAMDQLSAPPLKARRQSVSQAAEPETPHPS